MDGVLHHSHTGQPDSFYGSERWIQPRDKRDNSNPAISVTRMVQDVITHNRKCTGSDLRDNRSDRHSNRQRNQPISIPLPTTNSTVFIKSSHPTSPLFSTTSIYYLNLSVARIAAINKVLCSTHFQCGLLYLKENLPSVFPLKYPICTDSALLVEIYTV